MNDKAPATLSLGQQITYGFPHLAMAVSGVLFGEWLTYFYLPPEEGVTAGRVALVAASAFAVAQLIGRVIDAIADPLVGYWSDRSRSRFGRRLPFMFFGAPILALSFGLMWFPPFAPGSFANSTYLVATLCFYWFAFTLVVAPYLALMPEIARTNKTRVALSSFMAAFNVLGMAGGAILIGTLQEALPDGITILGIHIPTGIQVMGITSSVLLWLAFWVPLINIKEVPGQGEKTVPKGLFKGVAQAFKNPAFRTYLAIASLVQMGLIIVVAGLPYLATQVLSGAPGATDSLIPPGQGEAWAGYMQGGVVLGAALLIPVINILVPKMGKKRLFIYSGILMTLLLVTLPVVKLFPDPAIPALVFFGLLTFPISASLVLPYAIYGDVVDYEAERTGIRREGTYTGATALVTKAAIGLAQASVVGVLVLGNTRSESLGIMLCFPLGAFFVGLGTAIFSRHPIDA